MTEKERLGEVLLKLRVTSECDKTHWCEDCEHFGSMEGCARYCAMQTAEKLIANGVRVGSWISVKDELPAPDVSVFVATDEKGDVAYWTPIPKLPKGCVWSE